LAGAKQFKPSEALDQALRVFWMRGFEGASYSELTAATGLNKSSLYNAFGDKEALYLKCLERFSETFGAPLAATLDRPDFVDAIAGFFEGLLMRLGTRGLPRGCPMTMAALELGGTEGPVGKTIHSNLEITEAALRARCERAVRDGDLPEGTDCAALAALFLALARGLPALNRGFGDLRSSVLAVQAMLRMLKCPPMLDAGPANGQG
jgi:AcrR family transcriptional regulator